MADQTPTPRDPDARQRVLLAAAIIGLLLAAGLAVLALIPGVRPRAADQDTTRVAAVIAQTIDSSGIDAAVSQYRALRARGFAGLVETEADINALGYALLRKGDTNTAIQVFRLNAETHPDSANVYDSLGEAYLLAGHRAEALVQYEKALQIDPRLKSAASAVSTLTGRPRRYAPLVLFHVVNGMVGLATGAAAMILRKGSRFHSWAGRAFGVSMLAMSGSAAYLDAFVDPNGRAINVLMGLLTFYLVSTAWVAARRRRPQTTVVDWLALGLAAAVGLSLVMYGLDAIGSETGTRDGAPAGVYFAFAGVAGLAVAFDVRALRRGGVTGAQRVTQHLWRMCVAMFIAVTSLFLGQPQLFPAAIRNSGALAVPSLLVILSLGYWLYRVNGSRRPFAAPRLRGAVAGEAH